MSKGSCGIKKLSTVALTWLLLAFFILFSFSGCDNNKPNPEFVQVVNPLVEVNSLEEMEDYLDFTVPVLEKEVENYIVLVIDGYPVQARIKYLDGTSFDMKFGSGDVSGIYGGSLVKEETVNGVKVSFMNYEDINYALWEKDGFTFSLAGGDLTSDLKMLIK